MRSYHGEAVRQADIRTGRHPSTKKRKKEKPKRPKQRTSYGNSDSEENSDSSEEAPTPGRKKERNANVQRYHNADDEETTTALQARVASLEQAVKTLAARTTPPRKKLQQLHSREPSSGSESEESDASMDVPTFIKDEKLVLTQKPDYEDRGSVLHVDSDSYLKLKDQDGNPLLPGWIEVKKFTLTRGWGNLEFPRDQILLNPNKPGKVCFLCVHYVFRVYCFATRSMVHIHMHTHFTHSHKHTHTDKGKLRSPRREEGGPRRAMAGDDRGRRPRANIHVVVHALAEHCRVERAKEPEQEEQLQEKAVDHGSAYTCGWSRAESAIRPASSPSSSPS
jgi:hypothetical protein